MVAPKTNAKPAEMEEPKGDKVQARQQKEVDDRKKFIQSYPCYMSFRPKEPTCQVCPQRGTCQARTKLSGNDVFYNK